MTLDEGRDIFPPENSKVGGDILAAHIFPEVLLMSTHHSSKSKTKHRQAVPLKKRRLIYALVAGAALVALLILFVPFRAGFAPAPHHDTDVSASARSNASQYQPKGLWLQRAYRIDKLFHQVYTPGWEGAYGALGDAYLFAATHDTALLLYHTVVHPLTRLDNGYWLDDRAWACLAELTWWELTGKTNMRLVTDAAERYNEARAAGMLSNHEGYWTWYNYPPGANVKDPIFTNTNMNQMVNVACRLYDATRNEQYLKDALLVWNGDGATPGIEKKLYQGKGRWKGREGRAAFGKELPWGGTGYCSIGASLYRTTKDPKYRKIVVETAKVILDPGTGWVDPVDFYQIHMDGNGAFVHFLLDAYSIAPDELADIPGKIEKMLEHVWTNHHGTARVMLHRELDGGIRNGWNPEGGEDGYGVGEVGTVHAQGEAVRAFGIFAYFKNAK